MHNINDMLQNPEIYKINRLDPHSDHLFYENIADASTDNRSLFFSLNGEWKFKWSKNLSQRPADFYKTDYSLDDFESIPVPSHIELNGYDKINYVNKMYPWDGVCHLRPPFIDQQYNPVGSYATFFDVPQNFIDKTVCVSFKGVEQAFSLYLNGEFVGYSEDTFTPSDFDLSPFIKPKGNRLCVEVYKKACTAWIEDQDFFRFSGIFRDVLLYAKPLQHIEDIWVKPIVNDDLKNGEFSFSVKMANVPHISFEIKDADNKTIIQDTPSFTHHKQQKTEPAETEINYYVSPTYKLENISLWGINKPNLYNLLITVKDENGNVSEIVSQDFGFRHFVINNAVMYLNGERLIINGVNRHEWNPLTGRAISKQDMLQDIEVFKRNKITAVRTSHYPNQDYFYELCDKNGIIMMDETNLESHGSWEKPWGVDPSWNVPGNDEKWRNCSVDRAVSMFELHKNHPSILWWSCGNEAYSGEVILAIANYFRKKDSSRFVHYESCHYDENYHDCTDVYSRMYASPTEIDEFLSKGYNKPFVLCEYMHDMGNSLGGMESYIKLLDKYENYQGGFIWDYMDQAIYTEKNGVRYLGYGGDFGDRPTDYSFSGNGIVFANRAEKPAMQEVRYWFSSVEERAKHDEQNAQKIKQLAVKHTIQNGKKFEVINGDYNFGVKGEGFSVIFSHLEGGIVSLKYDDYEWIYRATKPTYWRALTENDKASGFGAKSGIWSYATTYSKHKEFKITEQTDDYVTIVYIFDTLIGTDTHVSYTVYCDGTIKVMAKLLGANLPQLPLFGIDFIIPDSVKNYQYIGYSGETYPDRYKGGIFDNHQQNVEISDYLVPQENGCHINSHKATLNMGENKLSIIMSDKPFHFSLLGNSAAELETATHKHELPTTGLSHLRIMSKMRGVGGIDTWGQDVESQYHIHADQDITLEFFVTNK